MSGVEGVVGDAEAGQPVVGHVLGAGVLRLGENGVVAALQRGKQRAGHSAHAGGIGHGALAVLQRRQLLFKIVLRGIGDAAVGKALGVVVAGADGVVGGVEVEGGRLINGRDQCAVGIPGLAGVYLGGVEFYLLGIKFRMLHDQLAHKKYLPENYADRQLLFCLSA